MRGKRGRIKKPGGKREGKSIYISLGLLIALAILLGLYVFARPKLGYIGLAGGGSSKRQMTSDEGKKAEIQIKEAEFKIFFPWPEGRKLKPEKRTLTLVGGLEERVAALFGMLSKGPLDKGSFMTLAPFELKHIFIDQNGLAYLDLAAPPAKEGNLGAIDESLLVYSIVNTVIFNFPEVKKVKFLLNGEEKETFAGHIDISKPLGPNTYLAGEMTQ